MKEMELFKKLYLDLSQDRLNALSPVELEKYTTDYEVRKDQLSKVFDTAISELSIKLNRWDAELDTIWRGVAQGNGIDLGKFRQRGIDKIADEAFLTFVKSEKERLFS